MSRLALPDYALNGGFPEPPASAPVRVVAAHHDACGASTHVRLPGSLPAHAVHRFHCAGCAAAFEAQQVEEIELRMAGQAEPEQPDAAEVWLSQWIKSAKTTLPSLATDDQVVAATPAEPEREPELEPPAWVSEPKRARPKLTMPKPKLPSLTLPSFDPESHSWKLLSIPIAALFVIVGLLALRGGSEQPSIGAPGATQQAQAGGNHDGSASTGKPASKPSKETKFVSESSFSLAMPAGWQRIDPPAGATFAAVATDGGADATLWITQDPKLDFPTFISQSLAQLETLAGSAQIVARIPAPTAEGTIVRLAADSPPGQPTYEVTLRVAGAYRYYLATSVQPDAGPEVGDAVDLITGSLTPELEG